MEKSAGPTLAATQQLLKTLITAPEDVAAQLGHHPEWTLPVTPSRTLTAIQRVQIYANMYRWRIHDALVEDFPAVRTYIGASAFFDLVIDYLAAVPPASFTLRHVGERLAAFLAAHPCHQEYPFLADVARFEWSLLDVFDAADAQPMTAATLREVPATAWPRLQLHLIPAHTLLVLQWQVDAVHETVAQHEGAPPPPPRQPVELLLWRKAHAVLYRPVDAFEADILRKVQTGMNFADLCTHAATLVAEDTVVARVGALLETWIEAQLLATP